LDPSFRNRGERALTEVNDDTSQPLVFHLLDERLWLAIWHRFWAFHRAQILISASIAILTVGSGWLVGFFPKASLQANLVVISACDPSGITHTRSRPSSLPAI